MTKQSDHYSIGLFLLVCMATLFFVVWQMFRGDALVCADGAIFAKRCAGSPRAAYVYSVIPVDGGLQFEYFDSDGDMGHLNFHCSGGTPIAVEEMALMAVTFGKEIECSADDSGSVHCEVDHHTAP